MKLFVITLAPALLLFIMILAVVMYNRLVAMRNRYRNAFSQIDVQLKRRHDLIPNLMETAKGYLQHERQTLEGVTTARAQAIAAIHNAELNPGDPQPMRDLGEAETALSGALGRLLAVSEAYPELKANQTMALLMEELTTTENRIAFARQAYNDAVMFYNTAVHTVPTNLLAGAFHFGPAEFFVLENASEKTAPNVSFQ